MLADGALSSAAPFDRSRGGANRRARGQLAIARFIHVAMATPEL
jgi:hypothetical protein